MSAEMNGGARVPARIDGRWSDRDGTEDYAGDSEFEDDDQNGAIVGDQADVSVAVLSAPTEQLSPALRPLDRSNFESASVTDALVAADETNSGVVSDSGPSISDDTLPIKPIGGRSPAVLGQKYLPAQRSFSVPAVPGVPADAAAPSQRSASVPTVPIASIRDCGGVSDGEICVRSKATRAPLPILDETMQQRPEDEESESDQDDESSGGEHPAANCATTARFRSLSLQHREKQRIVVPLRKAKSYVNRNRLPRVCEVGMGEHVEQSQDTGECSVNEDSKHATNESTLQASACSPPNCVRPADTPGGDTNCRDAELADTGKLGDGNPVAGTSGESETTSATVSSSQDDNYDSRFDDDDEQSNNLMGDSKNDQHTDTDVATTRSEPDDVDALIRENALSEANPVKTADCYGDDDFNDGNDLAGIDDADRYMTNDDDFDDHDEYVTPNDGATSSSTQHDICSATDGTGYDDEFDVEDFVDNRRETEGLLLVAQSLISAQSGGGVDRAPDTNNVCSDIAEMNSCVSDNSAAPSVHEAGESTAEATNSGYDSADDNFNDENDSGDDDNTDRYASDDGGVDSSGDVDNNNEEHELSAAPHQANEMAQECASDAIVAGGAVTASCPAKVAAEPNSIAQSIPVELDGNNVVVRGAAAQQNDSKPATRERGTKLANKNDGKTSEIRAERRPSPRKVLKPAPPPARPIASTKAKATARHDSEAPSSPEHSTPAPRVRKLHISDSSAKPTKPVRSPNSSAAKPVGTEREKRVVASLGVASSEITGETPSALQVASSPKQTRSPKKPQRPAPSPSKQQEAPETKEYPKLPRKDHVPKQKVGQKRIATEAKREHLKPVRGPVNLRFNIAKADKTKRDWLFLNMFRHGDDVSKYESFVPRTALPEASKAPTSTRPHSARTLSNAYQTPAFGGRRLVKPDDQAIVARERNWVALTPRDSAIPTYDSILDKHCSTVTSPAVQRQIYQTRCRDLTPQVAFVLEKRVEKFCKEAHSVSGEARTPYRTHKFPSPPKQVG